MKLLITEEQYKFIFKDSPIASNDINEKLPLIKKFIDFCMKDLVIDIPINALITDDKSKTRTFAKYNNDEQKLTVYIKNRHIGDVLRSIAHELKHHQQNLNGELNSTSGDDGSPEENAANAFAGVMMRKFGRLYPVIYE